MNLEKINNQYAFLFKSACSSLFIPRKLIEGKMPYTLISKEFDTFVLDPPYDRPLMPAPLGSRIGMVEDNIGVVYRMIIEDSLMNMLETDFGLGCLYLSAIINAMLFEATKFKTDLSQQFKVVSFNRPGLTNEFFQKVIDSEGFEVRLYVEF